MVRDLIFRAGGYSSNADSNKISIIFQYPMTSLNPYMRIRDQLNEILIHHKGYSKNQATKESIRMLDAVKIPNSNNKIHMFCIPSG